MEVWRFSSPVLRMRETMSVVLPTQLARDSSPSTSKSEVNSDLLLLTKNPMFCVAVTAIPRTQIDPSDPPVIDVGAQLSLFCSDMRTEPEELEELKWRRNGELLVTGGNIVVFPETGELVISDIQVSGPGCCGPGCCGPGRCGPGRCGPGRCGPGRCGPGRCGQGCSFWRKHCPF